MRDRKYSCSRIFHFIAQPPQKCYNLGMFKENRRIFKEGGGDSLMGRAAKAMTPLATPAERAEVFSNMEAAGKWNRERIAHGEGITVKLQEIVNTVRDGINKVYTGTKEVLKGTGRKAADLVTLPPVFLYNTVKGVVWDAPTKLIATLLMLGTHHTAELLDVPAKILLGTRKKIHTVLA